MPSTRNFGGEITIFFSFFIYNFQKYVIFFINFNSFVPKTHENSKICIKIAFFTTVNVISSEYHQKFHFQYRALREPSPLNHTKKYLLMMCIKRKIKGISVTALFAQCFGISLYDIIGHYLVNLPFVSVLGGKH